MVSWRLPNGIPALPCLCLPPRLNPARLDDATQELLHVARLLLRNDYKPMARIFIEQIAAAIPLAKAEINSIATRLRTEGNISSAVHIAKAALRRKIA